VKKKLKPSIKIRVYQTNFSPGFAFYQAGKRISSTGKALVGLDIGNLLGLVKSKDIAPKELPYFVAQVLMHEVFHALEDWARVEFNEKRVDQLVAKYEKEAKRRKR